MLAWGILIGIFVALYILPVFDFLCFFLELKKQMIQANAQLQYKLKMKNLEDEGHQTHAIGFITEDDYVYYNDEDDDYEDKK